MGDAGGKVLLVHHSSEWRERIYEMLLAHGYQVICFPEVRAIPSYHFGGQIDVILAEANSGGAPLQRVSSLRGAAQLIFLLSGGDEISWDRLLREGVFDVLDLSDINPDRLNLRVRRAVSMARIERERQMLAEQLRLSERGFGAIQENLDQQQLQTICAIVQILEAKDPYTRGHSDRVAGLSMAMAEAMGLTFFTVQEIQTAALLHDLGKVGIRESLLAKPGPLTAEEYEHLKTHADLGANIMERIKRFEKLTPLIRFHHERMDGSGYPQGLKGEEVPLGARIIAVADTLDAMTSDRPYRTALSLQEAVGEIRSLAGITLDEMIVSVLLRTLEGKEGFFKR